MYCKISTLPLAVWQTLYIIPWFWSTSTLLSISSTYPVGWDCLWEDTLSCEWDLHYPCSLGCVHYDHASLAPLKGNDDQGDWDFALSSMHIRHTDLGWDKLHIVFIELLSDKSLSIIYQWILRSFHTLLWGKIPNNPPLDGNLKFLSPYLFGLILARIDTELFFLFF